MSIKQKKSLPPDLLDERLLSVDEIAELDRTSIKSVRRKIASGKLKALKLSTNCVRVRVRDWRAARSTPA